MEESFLLRCSNIQTQLLWREPLANAFGLSLQLLLRLLHVSPDALPLVSHGQSDGVSSQIVVFVPFYCSYRLPLAWAKMRTAPRTNSAMNPAEYVTAVVAALRPAFAALPTAFVRCS